MQAAPAENVHQKAEHAGDVEISGVSPFVSEMRLTITKRGVDLLVPDANSVHVSDRALTRSQRS